MRDNSWRVLQSIRGRLGSARAILMLISEGTEDSDEAMALHGVVDLLDQSMDEADRAACDLEATDATLQ